MGREKKIKTIEDKHLFDKASGVAIATSVLAKCYEAGELVWKEDLKKKQKKKDPKLSQRLEESIKYYF
jgi:hypothetical protein